MVVRGKDIDKDYFNGETPHLVDQGIEMDVEAIAKALVNIYQQKYDIDHDIDENLYRDTVRILQDAIDNGYADAVEEGVTLPDEKFREVFEHSAEVFSAFRVHRMQQDIAAEMLDANGNVKPFREFVKDVTPYIDHQNRAWLQTEYDTAILRAQNAAAWKQFKDEEDVYPNLEWIQSTSPNPGQDHVPFWGTILPVDDPFWDEHKPGDRWNCKCELRQTDRDANTPPSGASKLFSSSHGLESNPYKAKEVFSDRHPYFPKGCSSCPFAGNKLMALAHDLAKGKDCMRCRAVDRCIATAEKKAEAEKKSKVKGKRSALHKAFQQIHKLKPRKYTNKALATGVFNDSSEGLRAIIAHCFDEDRLRAAMALRKKIGKLRFVRKSPFGEGKNLRDPKAIKNLNKKKRRGVTHYNVYEWKHKGDVYIVKMEVNKKGFETLYWIRKKE